ncbi:MAG: hypothetical protein ACLUIW_09310 [Dysosmobacter welbionis]
MSIPGVTVAVNQAVEAIGDPRQQGISAVIGEIRARAENFAAVLSGDAIGQCLGRLVQGKRCPGGVRRNGVGYLAVRKLQGNAGNAVAVEAAVVSEEEISSPADTSMCSAREISSAGSSLPQAVRVNSIKEIMPHAKRNFLIDNEPLIRFKTAAPRRRSAW